MAVLLTSLFSPDLVYGVDEDHVRVAAMVNWFWGLLGTVFVLRSTVFLRPNELGFGQDTAWGWIAPSVTGIWAAATIVALAAPTITVATDIDIPIGAGVAPVLAATLTWYVCQFLVEGFAAREAGYAS